MRGPIAFLPPVSGYAGGGTVLDTRMASPVSLGGESSAPLVPFSITGVSQTAGRAAGGTVITVTAAGIVGTPTSTLGAVSNVTASTFQITTSTHAAGVISWTATNGNGAVSSAQSYTYLASPTLASLTPNNGPQTLTTPGVAVAGTNFPPTGSGCPVTLTIDAQGASAYALVSSTSFTCTVPTGPSSGAFAASVTVDSVAATGSPNWTWNPPPSFTSSTNVGTRGGTVNVTGGNFVATPTASVSGGIGSLGVSYTSSSALVLTLAAGTYTAGSYTLTITNPDGQSVVVPNGFVITSATTPDVIWGTALRYWYDGSNTTQSGGVVTGITDLSLTGNTPTPTSLAYNAASGNFNGLPSWSWNGSSSSLVLPSLNLGSNVVWNFMAVRLNAAGTNPSLWQSGNRYTLQGSGSTGKPEINSVATWATSIVGTSIQLYAYAHGTGATSQDNGVSVQNATAVTATSTLNQPDSTGDTVSWGSSYSGGIVGPYANMEAAEIVGINRDATPTELTEFAAYLSLKYNLSPPLQFTGATTIAASSGAQTFRVAGANFASGCTVTLGGGIGAASVTFVDQGHLECGVSGTFTPGTYSLTIANPDESAIMVPNGFTVLASDTTDPMACLGTTCVLASYGTAGILGSAGVVTSFADLSLAGNTLSPTGSPGFTASDSAFNGEPSASMSSGNYVSQGTMAGIAANSPLWIWMVVKLSSTAIFACFGSYGGTDEFRCSQSSGTAGVPSVEMAGTFTDWSASIGTNARAVYWYETGGTSWTQGVNVSNGTEVTASNSGTGLSGNQALGVGARAGGPNAMTGKIAAVLVCRAIPSSTQRAAIETWAQNLFGVP